MEKNYKQVSCKKYPSGCIHSIYEKNVGCFVFNLNNLDSKDADEVTLQIKKGENGIAFIKSAYFPEDKTLFIQDMDTHFDYRRIGLGRLRMKEVLSFLKSKGEIPQTVIAEEVGYLGIPDGKEFFKSLGFQPIENSQNWKVSIEELVKRLQKK